MARSARDYITSLCHGTLYERLAAAADLPEVVEQTATEWNDFVIILQTFASSSAQAIESPTIDVATMQRRILAAYAPVLRGEPLTDLLLAHEIPDPGEFVSIATPSALQQAGYIDRVRRELGELTETTRQSITSAALSPN